MCNLCVNVAINKFWVEFLSRFFFFQRVILKCGSFNVGGYKLLVPVCVPAWCGCAGEAEEVAAAAGAQDS